MTDKPPMRLLVCGPRGHRDRLKVYQTMDYIHSQRGVSCVISGGAPGTDTFSADWAMSRGVDLEEYMADWNKFGKTAGPIRNKVMIDKGKPDGVLAFSRDDGTWGAGTTNMVNLAIRRGLPVSRVK